MIRLFSSSLLVLGGLASLSCQPGSFGSYPDLTSADGAVGDAMLPPTGDAGPADDAPPAIDAPPDAPVDPCVDGDDQVIDPSTGHCYMAYRAPVVWEAAQDQCENIGAHLMDITSADENAFILELAGELNTWMGGNDRAQEGSWVWLNGDAFTYTNWRDGEPNNSTNNDPVNGEDCGIFEGPRGGTWDDRPCNDNTHQFICERE